jgi:hypothetical protein
MAATAWGSGVSDNVVETQPAAVFEGGQERSGGIRENGVMSSQRRRKRERKICMAVSRGGMSL